jgi:hypothetical protein
VPKLASRRKPDGQKSWPSDRVEGDRSQGVRLQSGTEEAAIPDFEGDAEVGRALTSQDLRGVAEVMSGQSVGLDSQRPEQDERKEEA